MFRLRFKNHPEVFMRKRIAILDQPFQMLLKYRFLEFCNGPKSLVNCRPLQRHFRGELPDFAATNLKWDKDVDYLYDVVQIGSCHYAGMVVDIPNRTINMYDGMNGISNDETVEDAVRPFARIIPNLFRLMAPDALKATIDTSEYKVVRVRDGLPQGGEPYGDCGVYAIKFLECHAMGVEMDPKQLCDSNMHFVRLKLAADMYNELIKPPNIKWNPIYTAEIQGSEAATDDLFMYCKTISPSLQKKKKTKDKPKSAADKKE